MDDDIDIEEHDVLDNPVIKSVFPDISVIKKEISKFFEEEAAIKEESELPETKPKTDNLQINDGVSHSQSYASQTLNTPVVKDNNIVNNANSVIQSNKIILGSKPNNVTEKLDSKRIEVVKVKFKEMKIKLQDIKSYLDQNGRYCKECCTLFLSKNNLAAHKIKVHDNKMFKDSTKIRNKNVIETKHKCQICNSYFAHFSSLKRHINQFHKSSIKTGAKYYVSSLLSEHKTSTIVKMIKGSNGNEKIETAATKVKNDKYFKTAKSKNRDSSDKKYLRGTKISKRKQTIRKQSNKKARHKCNICGYLFSSRSNLSRHYKNIHKKNIKFRMKGNTRTLKGVTQGHQNLSKEISNKNQKPTATKEKNFSSNDKHKKARLKRNIPDKEDQTVKYITRSQNDVSKDNNFCVHCNKTFSDQKSLIKHMYEILEPKRSSNDVSQNYEIARNLDETITKKDDEEIFTCRHCSYYLPTLEAYFVHMIKNHKTEVFLEVCKEMFDEQCKYCPSKSNDVINHNKHVHKQHRSLMNKKIENEKDKQRDSGITKSDTVYENIFNEYQTFALESLLFECIKCSVCFLSSNIARDHKQHMEFLINWKCSICHHILKNHDQEMHLKQHSFPAPIKLLKLNETELCNVLYNCTKCTIHFTEKRYQEHYEKCEIEPTESSYCNKCDILVDKIDMTFHETKHKSMKDVSDFIIVDSNVIVDTVPNRKRKGTNNESELTPPKRVYQQNNCYTFCKTCKCFLTDMGLSNKAHVNGACSHIQRSVCYQCGLILTTRSMITAHRPKHLKDKRLRLQDFKFFDLKGKQITPPIPEYPHCEICGIHFLTKTAIASHMCDETDFLTCDVCNIKLTETAFKLHMSFHFYFIQKAPTSNLPSNSGGSDLPEYQSVKVLIKPTEKLNDNQLEMQESKQITESGKHDLNVLDLKLDTTSQNQKAGQLKEHISDVSDCLLVLYKCKKCSIAVASYDEVIEHCRSHYNAVDKKSSAKVYCTKCSLKLDSSTFKDHQQTFHSGATEMKVLKFDPNYFTCENKIWVKHIFEKLPDNMVKKLIDESIYQQEHRIKLNLIQKSVSSLNLNVYKCGSCGNIIDADCVYKHTEKPCPKVRIHPCSICGLPLISGRSRYNHEKLHRSKSSFNLKALNIISFNETQDKSYNNSILCTNKQYILYQCRNCDRVAKKSQLTKHVCDRNTLRKCLVCGLLLCLDDFKTHISKHTDIENYCASNFKIILFGKKDDNDDNNEPKLCPSFSGTVYDYTLYKCQNCEICLKNFEYSEKHTCALHFDLDRTICSKCGLYFPSGYLKYHKKQHSTDPEFVKENMNVITFKNINNTVHGSPFTHEKSKTLAEKINTKKIYVKNEIEKKINIGSSINNDIHCEKNCAHDTIDNNVKENFIKKIKETANNNDDNKFLCVANKSSNGEINERKNENTIENKGRKKEKIVSTSNECRENSIYNGKRNNVSQNIENDDNIEKNMERSNRNIVNDVLESINADKDDNSSESNEGKLDDNKCNVDDCNKNTNEKVTLYKCKCGLHFANRSKSLEHFKKCHPKAKRCKQNCSKCHLLFNPSELFSHLLVHHKNKTQNNTFNVIDISVVDK